MAATRRRCEQMGAVASGRPIDVHAMRLPSGVHAGMALVPPVVSLARVPDEMSYTQMSL